MLPKLKLEDLKIGMEVDIRQLEEIYDTWIFLISENYNSTTGIIKFIGKETNDESQKIFELGKVVSPIYHDSLMMDEDVSYDE